MDKKKFNYAVWNKHEVLFQLGRNDKLHENQKEQLLSHRAIHIIV